jgi:hypothetical protein
MNSNQGNKESLYNESFSKVFQGNIQQSLENSNDLMSPRNQFLKVLPPLKTKVKQI